MTGFEAERGIGDNHSDIIMNVSKNPHINKKSIINQLLEGWQYTSKGWVARVKGNEDMNLWYSDTKEHTGIIMNPYSAPERFLPAQNCKGKNNIDGVFVILKHHTAIIPSELPYLIRSIL